MVCTVQYADGCSDASEHAWVCAHTNTHPWAWKPGQQGFSTFPCSTILCSIRGHPQPAKKTHPLHWGPVPCDKYGKGRTAVIPRLRARALWFLGTASQKAMRSLPITHVTGRQKHLAQWGPRTSTLKGECRGWGRVIAEKRSSLPSACCFLPPSEASVPTILALGR